MSRIMQLLAMLAVVLAVALPAQAASATFGGVTTLVVLCAGVLLIAACGAVVVNLVQRRPMHPEP